MRRAVIYTDDLYLRRKLELELEEDYECISAENADVGDIAVIDLDTAEAPIQHSLSLCLSRDGKADARLPLRVGEICELISRLEDCAPPLSVLKGERAALLQGRKIRLTELEYSLLSRLVFAGGEFVSRETLLGEIFGSDGSGMLTLYVHYLREKLETGGEKVILSSRQSGYRISEKFLKGDKIC